MRDEVTRGASTSKGRNETVCKSVSKVDGASTSDALASIFKHQKVSCAFVVQTTTVVVRRRYNLRQVFQEVMMSLVICVLLQNSALTLIWRLSLKRPRRGHVIIVVVVVLRSKSGQPLIRGTPLNDHLRRCSNRPLLSLLAFFNFSNPRRIAFKGA